MKETKKRVKLIKTLNKDKLPVGSEGVILEGTMDEPGMLVIKWDKGFTLPMYRSELEII